MLNVGEEQESVNEKLHVW